MATDPIAQIIVEIGQWGKKNGKRIVEAFFYEGDWCAWAQVEVALWFKDYANVAITRAVQLADNLAADIFMMIEGNKSVVMQLKCELLPSSADNPNAIGDEYAYKYVLKDYEQIKQLDLSKYLPVAMGLMVSRVANDTAKVNLCDQAGFQYKSIYSDKSNNIGLFYKNV